MDLNPSVRSDLWGRSTVHTLLRSQLRKVGRTFMIVIALGFTNQKSGWGYDLLGEIIVSQCNYCRHVLRICQATNP